MFGGSLVLAAVFWIASGALVGGVIASIASAEGRVHARGHTLKGMAVGAAVGLALLLVLNSLLVAFIVLAVLILVGAGLVVLAFAPEDWLAERLERLPEGLRRSRWVRRQMAARRNHQAAEESVARPWPEGLPRGVYWVSPGRLLAGPYPYIMLDRVLSMGVTHFVNLTQPRELMPYEGVLPAHVSHERRPIPDLGVPSPDQMRATLDAIDSAMNAGKTVYVHCWGGIGRTGTVIGCWLVRHGLSGPAALEELARLRAGNTDSPETDEQHDFVRDWREI